MKKYSKLFAILLAVAMILPSFGQIALADEGVKVTRLSGDNRSLTSIAVSESEEAYKAGADTVIVVGYEGSADALTGSLLAKSKNAPLLIAGRGDDEKTEKVVAEIERLGAKNVIILGGETAVAPAVAAKLEAISGVTVTREKGDNRYETAAKLAAEATNTENVFLALGRAENGKSLADALVIGPASAKEGMPVLLTETDKLRPETKKALEDLGVKDVTIIGGEVAISAAVETEVKDMGINVSRISGDNRYETAVAVAEKYFADADNILLASGEVDYDALVGGYLGAKLNAPILLTKAGKLRDETKGYLTANKLNTYVLGGTSVVAEAVAEEVVEALEAEEEGEELKVVSVSAINLKQIEVTFNKDVDATTVNAANFDVRQTTDVVGRDRMAGVGEVDNTGATVAAGAATGSVVLGNDNKTVILTLNNNQALTNASSVVVNVSGVKDIAGSTLADVSKTITASDSIVPTVQKIESVGSDQFRIVFNEPVTTTNDGSDTGLTGALAATTAISVDSNAVYVSSVARDGQNPKALLVTVGGTLAGGDHTVVVNTGVAASNPIVDYAGYAVVKTTQTYNHVADATAPTFTAEARNEKTVRLTFNKPVDILGKANVSVRHSYNAPGAVQVLANAPEFVPVPNTNNTKYDVTFASPLPVGNLPIYVSYVNDSNLTAANSVRDSYGNMLVNGTSATVTTVADTTAPTVSSVKVVNATTIDVDYSEAVTGANVTTNYTLTDPKGNAVAVSNAQLRTGTTATYRLTVGTMEDGGNFKLDINTNIRDTSVSQNRLAAYTTTLAVADTKAPTFDGVYHNTAKTEIYVQFSEAMNDTVLNKANYRFADTSGNNTSSLPTTATLTKNGSVVTIKLAEANAGLGAGNFSDLIVGSVSDLAGNAIANLSSKQAFAAVDMKDSDVSDIRVISVDTMTFVFNRHLKAVDTNKFTLNAKGSGPVKPSSVTYVNNANNTATVTVKTAAGSTNEFNTNLSSYAGLVIAADGLTDINGIKNSTTKTGSSVDDAFNSLAAANDFVAPAIATGGITTIDSTGNGQIDAIDVVFTEDLYIPSVQESDFTVEGYTITGVSTASATVTITVTEKSTPDTGVTPKVTLVGSVQDLYLNSAGQRNTLSAQSAITAVDAAAPRLLSVTVTDKSANGFGDEVGDKLTLKFTEEIVAGNTLNASKLEAMLTFSGTVTDANNFNATGITYTVVGNTIVCEVTDVTTPSTNLVVAGGTVAFGSITANDVEDLVGNDLAGTVTGSTLTVQ